MSNPVPRILVQGDTYSWVAEYADYPSSVWTLTTTLINKDSKITLPATPQADESWLIELDAITTGGYVPGNYDWTSKVTDGTHVHTLERGCSTVQLDLSGQTTYDGRSWAERALEAVEAVLEGRASSDQEAYSIQGRSLSRTPLQDLVNLQKYLQSIVAAEACASGTGAGASNKKAVVRF